MKLILKITACILLSWMHFKSTVMKNLLLVFVGFLLTANLFAQNAPQKADTVFTYEWRSQVWELTWRSFNTYNKLVWNVKDEKGNAVTAGIYFLRMQIGNYVETKKIIVAR